MKSRTVSAEQLIEALRYKVSVDTPSLRVILPNGMYGFVFTPYEELEQGGVGRVYLPDYGAFSELWVKMEKVDGEHYVDLCVLCDKELVPLWRLERGWLQDETGVFFPVGVREWKSGDDAMAEHYPVEPSEFGYRMTVWFQTSANTPVYEGEAILPDLDSMGRLTIDGKPSDFWVGYQDCWWVFVLNSNAFLPIVDLEYNRYPNGFDVEPLEQPYRGCCG